MIQLHVAGRLRRLSTGNWWYWDPLYPTRWFTPEKSRDQCMAYEALQRIYHTRGAKIFLAGGALVISHHKSSSFVLCPQQRVEPPHHKRKWKSIFWTPLVVPMATQVEKLMALSLSQIKLQVIISPKACDVCAKKSAIGRCISSYRPRGEARWGPPKPWKDSLIEANRWCSIGIWQPILSWFFILTCFFSPLLFSPWVYWYKSCKTV